MRSVREGPVAIFPREQGLIDVFTGSGWNHHSMFKVIRGVPHLIKGYDPLSEKDYQHLLRECLK